MQYLKAVIGGGRHNVDLVDGTLPLSQTTLSCVPTFLFGGVVSLRKCKQISATCLKYFQSDDAVLQSCYANALGVLWCRDQRARHQKRGHAVHLPLARHAKHTLYQHSPPFHYIAKIWM